MHFCDCILCLNELEDTYHVCLRRIQTTFVDLEKIDQQKLID